MHQVLVVIALLLAAASAVFGVWVLVAARRVSRRVASGALLDRLDVSPSR